MIRSVSSVKVIGQSPLGDVYSELTKLFPFISLFYCFPWWSLRPEGLHTSVEVFSFLSWLPWIGWREAKQMKWQSVKQQPDVTGVSGGENRNSQQPFKKQMLCGPPGGKGWEVLGSTSLRLPTELTTFFPLGCSRHSPGLWNLISAMSFVWASVSASVKWVY